MLIRIVPMELYEQALLALGIPEWPTLLVKIGLPPVVSALNAWLTAYDADKAAIEEHDAFDEHVWPTPTTQAGLQAHWDKAGQLRRAATKTRVYRKRAFRKLKDALAEDYDYTSTDEEDENEWNEG
jgi:hypothetical protein